MSLSPMACSSSTHGRDRSCLFPDRHQAIRDEHEYPASASRPNFPPMTLPVPLLSVYIKRPLSTANYWQGKYPFFFAALCKERIVSMGFS